MLVQPTGQLNMHAFSTITRALENPLHTVHQRHPLVKYLYIKNEPIHGNISFTRLENILTPNHSAKTRGAPFLHTQGKTKSLNQQAPFSLLWI